MAAEEVVAEAVVVLALVALEADQARSWAGLMISGDLSARAAVRLLNSKGRARVQCDLGDRHGKVANYTMIMN